MKRLGFVVVLLIALALFVMPPLLSQSYAKEGEGGSRDKNILIYCSSSGRYYTQVNFVTLAAELEDMGYNVRLEDKTSVPNLTTLLPGNFSQMWLICCDYTGNGHLTEAEKKAITSFASNGNGLAIFTDSGVKGEHYVLDANLVAANWSVQFEGKHNYYKGCNSSLRFEDHPIVLGLGRVYTFANESKIVYTGQDTSFKSITKYGKKTLQAVYGNGKMRIFFDTSFARYLNLNIEKCDGFELIRNIACWLE